MTSTVVDIMDTPFREVGFRTPSVDIERRADGTLILRAGQPLPPIKSCTTDWLEHWATLRPTSPMLAQRNKTGEWVSWSVSEVWGAVRSIATA
jgi:feruloyl-CoA synthase